MCVSEASTVEDLEEDVLSMVSKWSAPLTSSLA